jgi:hypothetical protein
MVGEQFVSYRPVSSNYRPVSLASVVCKIMEHIIFSQVMKHLNDNNIIVHYQHGFRSGHSIVDVKLNY